MEGGSARLSLTAEYVIWHVQKCQNLAKCEAGEPFFLALYLPCWPLRRRGQERNPACQRVDM